MTTTYVGFKVGDRVTVVDIFGGFHANYLHKSGTIVEFDEGDSYDVRVKFEDNDWDWGKTQEIRKVASTKEDLEALRAELARAEAAYAESSAQRVTEIILKNQDSLQSLYNETQVLAQSIGRVFGFNEDYDEFILGGVSGVRWDSSNC